MSQVYVYALVERARRPVRIQGRRLEFVPVGGIYAAVERLSAPPDLNESALRDQHRIVVGLARKSDPMLPARFGAWVDLVELERIVRLRHQALGEAFDAVRGRQQMTVRIFGESEPSRDAVNEPKTGTAYLETRRAAARPRLSPAAESIQRALKPLVEVERIDAGSGRLRATMHHLVKRGCTREYRTLVDRVRTNLRPEEPVVVSGPWPPFAFAPELWT